MVSTHQVSRKREFWYDQGMKPPCSFPECPKVSYARGLCKGHNEQQRLGRELKTLRVVVPRGTWVGVTECSEEGCSKAPRAKGLCPGHLWQLQKSKSRELRPVKKFEPGEFGKWYLDANGYVTRTRYLGNRKSERQFQHRFVMESMLGRKLMPHENVHHRNGVRDDNSEGNLELWTTSQPSGQRVVDKIAWAKEFLAFYENDCENSDEQVPKR